MPNPTHCLPNNGTLGTDECPVPPVPGTTPIYTPSNPLTEAGAGPGGTPRAVIWNHHGLSAAGLTPPMQPPADVITDGIGGNFATLTNDWTAAGFVVVSMPQELGDFIANQTQDLSIYNDIENDPNTVKGTRHAEGIGHHADHWYLWTKKNYPGLPIVCFGMSWGGMYTLQMVTQRPQYFKGYGIHHPVSVPGKLHPSFGPNLSTITFTTGLDVPSTALNNITYPGYIGWGTSDFAVDYPNSGDLLTPAIYSSASGSSGTHVTSNSQAEAHVMSSTDVSAVMAWFGTTANSGQLPF